MTEPRTAAEMGQRRIPYAGYDPLDRPSGAWKGEVIRRVRPRPAESHPKARMSPKTRIRAERWVYPPVAPYDAWEPVLIPPHVTSDRRRRMHNGAANWRLIVGNVAEKHKVAVELIMGDRRARHIVAARHEAFYQLAEQTNMSLPAIGRKMGNKDHTTVLHGILRHKERLEGKR